MPDRYPHYWGGSQIWGQSAPPVIGTNGEKLKMLNWKFACISDPAANTMQTAVNYSNMNSRHEYMIILCTEYLKYIKVAAKPATLAPFKDQFE